MQRRPFRRQRQPVVRRPCRARGTLRTARSTQRERTERDPTCRRRPWRSTASGTPPRPVATARSPRRGDHLARGPPASGSRNEKDRVAARSFET